MAYRVSKIPRCAMTANAGKNTTPTKQKPPHSAACGEDVVVVGNGRRETNHARIKDGRACLLKDAQNWNKHR